MEGIVVLKAGNLTASVESEGSKIVSKNVKIAVSETLNQRNPQGKQRKTIMSTVACVLLRPRLTQVLFPVFFFF